MFYFTQQIIKLYTTPTESVVQYCNDFQLYICRDNLPCISDTCIYIEYSYKLSTWQYGIIVGMGTTTLGIKYRKIIHY